MLAFVIALRYPGRLGVNKLGHIRVYGSGPFAPMSGHCSWQLERPFGAKLSPT